MNFLTKLKQRNRLLYWFGWLNFFCAGICSLLIQLDDTVVLGINAWIKPLKFFLSTIFFVTAMAWYMYHLTRQKAVLIYSWVIILVLTFENIVIVWQAANGRLSHFNISSSFYGLLFS